MFIILNCDFSNFWISWSTVAIRTQFYTDNKLFGTTWIFVPCISITLKVRNMEQTPVFFLTFFMHNLHIVFRPITWAKRAWVSCWCIYFTIFVSCVRKKTIEYRNLKHLMFAVSSKNIFSMFETFLSCILYDYFTRSGSEFISTWVKNISFDTSIKKNTVSIALNFRSH